MERKPTLHIVDGSSRVRAELARIGFRLGHHAEVYGDLEELADRAPDDGIILLRDEGEQDCVARALSRLAAANVTLPALATDLEPRPARVVAAIKAGALDYLPLPAQEQRLARMLAEVDKEARAFADARRKIIEARKRIDRLSPREREVLDWLSQGCSNKAIARALEISPRTVEIHRAKMMSKLGASHPAEAVRVQLEAQVEQGQAGFVTSAS